MKPVMNRRAFGKTVAGALGAALPAWATERKLKIGCRSAWARWISCACWTWWKRAPSSRTSWWSWIRRRNSP